MIEKLPSNSDPRYQPPTSSVPVSVGTTAAEGARQGQQGNDAFNAGMTAPQRPIPKGSGE